MAPLRRRWDAVRAEAETLHASWQAAGGATASATRRRAELVSLLLRFQDDLTQLRVLDPACGSGNFLYVTLVKLLDLEKEVSRWAATHGLSALFSQVHPRQLLGLEINAYAAELASVVIWIGYLQWLADNGQLGQRQGAILEALDTIRLQDALLDRNDPAHPREAHWPEADVIIGNPPFLGAKKLRSELGDDYTRSLFRVYEGRVPGMSDLVGYFFEKARGEIAAGSSKRVGLLATNSIRDSATRQVLDRVKDTGDIFMAWSDEEWVVDGTAVRISIVGFDDGSEQTKVLDGTPVTFINSDLRASVEVRKAQPLPENQGLSSTGDLKGGPFDISGNRARSMLVLPLNPNGRPNSDVVRPRYTASDVVRRWQDSWIIDFGPDMSLDDAALYEAPFEYVVQHVNPVRETNNDSNLRKFWWIHQRPRPILRQRLARLHRYIVTPAVSKHRIYIWMDAQVLGDHRLVCIAREDDFAMGVLHSRAHECWAYRTGTMLGVGNDLTYNPTTCFETFPFPHPSDAQRAAIADAARRLVELRDAWLNPADADAATLKKRTLTNLYNERPTWLANAHATLDRAVWAAYGWPDEPAATDDETILTRLLALNLARAG